MLMASFPTIRLKIYAGFLLFGVTLVAVFLYHGDGTSMVQLLLASICFQAETVE